MNLWTRLKISDIKDKFTPANVLNQSINQCLKLEMLFQVFLCKGPSIYDVHTEGGGRGSGSGGRMWTGGGGPAPCGRPLELDRCIGNTHHRGRLWDNRNHRNNRQLMTIDDRSVLMFQDDVTHRIHLAMGSIDHPCSTI